MLKGHVEDLRAINLTPHVAQNNGPARFTKYVRADFRAQNRLDFRRIVRIGIVMGWPSQSRPGLAPRFAGLWVVRASSPASRANGA